MAAYGIDDFSIELAEECDIMMLNQREIHWIEFLNTQHPNGYNLKCGGDGNGKHAQVSINRIKATKHERLDKYRHSMLHGMPPNFAYREFPNGTGDIRILKHPMLKNVVTFHTSKYGTIEQTKAAALAYYHSLGEIPALVIDTGLDESVVDHEKRLVGGRHGAKYITRIHDHSYKVRIDRGDYTRLFTDKTKTSEQLYAEAVEYRNQVLQLRLQYDQADQFLTDLAIVRQAGSGTTVLVDKYLELNVQRLDTSGVTIDVEPAVSEICKLFSDIVGPVFGSLKV